jgi:hypothetical protein
MQRHRQKSVTSRYRRAAPNVPILVPTKNPKPDGLATFGGPPYEGVQVLLEGDFTNILLHQLTQDARERLRVLIKCREEIREEVDGSYWTTRLREVNQQEQELVGHVSQIVELAKRGSKKAAAFIKMMKRIEAKDQAELKMIMGRRSSGEWREDPFSYLSRAISQRLCSARFVLWWKGSPRPTKLRNLKRELHARIDHALAERSNLLVPAIYCPDLETACYVYELFRFCGRGFGICLECGNMFQKPKDGSLYCSQAHSDAHRIRRWRARKKMERE